MTGMYLNRLVLAFLGLAILIIFFGLFNSIFIERFILEGLGGKLDAMASHYMRLMDLVIRDMNRNLTDQLVLAENIHSAAAGLLLDPSADKRADSIHKRIEELYPRNEFTVALIDTSLRITDSSLKAEAGLDLAQFPDAKCSFDSLKDTDKTRLDWPILDSADGSLRIYALSRSGDAGYLQTGLECTVLQHLGDFMAQAQFGNSIPEKQIIPCCTLRLEPFVLMETTHPDRRKEWIPVPLFKIKPDSEPISSALYLEALRKGGTLISDREENGRIQRNYIRVQEASLIKSNFSDQRLFGYSLNIDVTDERRTLLRIGRIINIVTLLLLAGLLLVFLRFRQYSEKFYRLSCLIGSSRPVPEEEFQSQNELRQISSCFNEHLAAQESVTKALLQAEKALSLEKYNALADAVSMVILSVDENLHITDANAWTSRITGLDQEALMGCPLVSLLSLFGNSADFFRQVTNLTATDIETQITAKAELSISEPGKEKIYLEFTALKSSWQKAAPLENPSASTGARIIIMGVDITQKLQDQRDREDLRNQMASFQKMEAIGGLASGVAHDLGNILTPIQGYTELMMRKIAMVEQSCSSSKETPFSGASDSNELYGYLSERLERIRSASRRGIDLTRQLLTFTRRNSQKTEVFDLNKTVSDFMSLASRIIDENIRVILQFDLPQLNIQGNQGKIEQVLLNLSVNSREAMPQGGELIFRTSLVEAKKTHDPDSRNSGFITCVLLQILDRGKGIPQDKIDHIFEPYFSTKPLEKNTGMGLAMVASIVAEHQGWIRVQPNFGGGTIFSIYLPAHDQTELNDETLPSNLPEICPLPGISGEGKTLLLVEDDRETSRFTKGLLAESGFRTLIAENAEQALALMETCQTPITMIISDVILPDLSGTDLATRYLQIFPQGKVILMSGYDSRRLEAMNHSDLKYRFVQKPFESAKMLSLISELLEIQ